MKLFVPETISRVTRATPTQSKLHHALKDVVSLSLSLLMPADLWVSIDTFKLLECTSDTRRLSICASIARSIYANDFLFSLCRFQMACSFFELLGLAIVAIVLFSVSSRMQYYVKMVTFLVSALAAAVAPIPLMLPRPRDYRNAL